MAPEEARKYASSKSSIRRRGRDHIAYLAIEVVKQIKYQGFACEYVPLLIVKKNIKDQSKLNGRQRIENTKGKFGLLNFSLLHVLPYALS